jgi:hypothetical protein
MRTKTLLIVAAAMAAGIATSMAQTTFSQNIVGYANVVLKGNGQFTLVSDPFSDGNGNIVSNIVNSALPGGVANPLGQAKITYLVGGSPTTIAKLASGAWNANPSFNPGSGFFVQNGKPGGNAPDITNTFVGTVAVLSGASVTNDIPTGFSLQGSVIPYAGNIAVSGTHGGVTNLDYGTSLSSPDVNHRSQITFWNVNAQSPTTVAKLVSGNWNGTVTVGVADAFYLFNPNADTNVVQSLP